MRKTALSKPEPESAGAPVRVVVVDHHALVREALIHMLQEASSLQPVGQAADGASAIALARKLQPDVALVDLGLPEMDGTEVAEQIRRVSPATRVIILSENESEESLVRALRAGVRGYVMKSLPFTGLIHAIERVLAGEVALPRDLTTRVVLRLSSRDPQRPPGGSRRFSLIARSRSCTVSRPAKLIGRSPPAS